MLLEHAVAKGNMDLFTWLLNAEADVSVSWWWCLGRRLLGSAVGGRGEETVLALSAQSRRKERETSRQGAGAFSAMLMLAGAGLEPRDRDKLCPLYVAAQAGHHGIAMGLLLKGA